MKRHDPKWLSCLTLDDLLMRIRAEVECARVRYGPFASAHELHSVLREELDEYYDSVRADDPDPGELMQVAAVAIRGALLLCEIGRMDEFTPQMQRDPRWS